MKQSIILFSILASISITSCKKDYTCVCTTASPIPGFSIPDQETAIGKQRKKQAETICTAKNNTLSFGGFSISTTCKLK